MVNMICAWYESWTLSVLHWYTSHPVLLASSVVGAAVLGVAIGVIGIIGAIRLSRTT
jgi:hypothetical protein